MFQELYIQQAPDIWEKKATERDAACSQIYSIRDYVIFALISQQKLQITSFLIFFSKILKQECAVWY